MKLSRYAFLTGAFSALALAGCGGGDDTPAVYDPVREYDQYKSRRVIVSADRKFEVIMYAYEEGETPFLVTCRAYGNQATEAFRRILTGETGANGESYHGNFFWAPTGHKLYGLITVYSHPSSTTFLTLMEPSLVNSTTMPYVYVRFNDTNFSTEVIKEYEAANVADIGSANTRLSATGFSADGNSLLYSKVVTSDQGSVTTNYAFNYQTNINTIVAS